MTIHEFGEGNGRTAVLIHPSLVMWDYFEYVIPLLIVMLVLTVPVAILAMRLAEKTLKKQTASLK